MQSFLTYLVQFKDNNKMISNSSSVKNCLRYSTKMKILSFVFAVFLTVSVSALPGVSARANQEKVKSNGLMSTQKNSSPFTICIDDSDCLKLGQGDKFLTCFFLLLLKIMFSCIRGNTTLECQDGLWILG